MLHKNKEKQRGKKGGNGWQNRSLDIHYFKVDKQYDVLYPYFFLI